MSATYLGGSSAWRGDTICECDAEWQMVGQEDYVRLMMQCAVLDWQIDNEPIKLLMELTNTHRCQSVAQSSNISKSLSGMELSSASNYGMAAIDDNVRVQKKNAV